MSQFSKKRVFVGVSGGVDSSVALALLKQQGYDVTGVFLKVWSPDFLPCTWRDERRSAMRVCSTLGVPFMTLDCEKEYKELVVDYMLSEYKAGRTPNPDVFCNKYVKFGIFLTKALEAGADCVATGHYSRVEERITNNESRVIQSESDSLVLRNSYFVLLESTDSNKDQSYFLHQLNQEQLSHILFPIGHLQKSEVRNLARKFGLPTAEKKDSQGLCFIGKVDMKEFLAHYIKSEPGNVLNEDGEIIGRHDGAIFYTIGERHGFQATQTNAEGDVQKPRLFVVAKDIEKNTITVGSKYETRITNNEKPSTRNSCFLLRDSMNWIIGSEPNLSNSFDVRFRYRQEKQKCKITSTPEGYEIIPDMDLAPTPVGSGSRQQSSAFGIAPGQSAVIYDGEICLGGGIIE